MINVKTALILAPHTDDGELGCGATISRMIRQNIDVWYVAFSRCEESLPKGLPRDTLVQEAKAATAELGIQCNHVLVKNYQVRHFSEVRQQILDDLIVLGKTIEPDCVFIPSPHDIHQDHATIAAEGIRAFKKKTVIAYELPWNNFSFNNQLFVRVTREDVQNKVLALAQYKSQVGRQYTQKENIEAILKTHGVQIGEEYAEVFEIPRMVL